MHIDNIYLKKLEVPSQAAPNGVTGSAEVRQNGGAGSSLQAASQHVPSPELLRYLGQLQEAPEVRPERLAQVAERLRRGDYSTPEAAQQTAEALLKAAE